MSASITAMDTKLTATEDFDLGCMCDLIDDEENKRVKAMEKVVLTYRSPLFSYVRNKFPSFSEEDARDTVQGVFISLWEKVAAGKFNGDGSLKSLLFTMAFRAGVDELRKRTALKRDDDEMVSMVVNCLDETAIAHAWKRAVDNKDHAADVMNAFRNFVSSLPKMQKLVAEAIYANASEFDDNAAIAQYINERIGKPVTVMMVKGAKQALIVKFRELLKNKGLLV